MDKQQLLRRYGQVILDSNNLLPQKLLQALHDGDVETCMDYVKRGVNLNFTDNNGWTLLHLAILLDNFEILDFLLKQPNMNINAACAGEPPLCLSMKLGSSEKIILRLIEAGADVSCENDILETPLHYAVSKCSLQVCHKLIEHGANVNATDIYGATPLHVALDTCKPNVEIIQMLLYYGADAGAKCSEEMTPFMKSLLRDDFSVAMELLEYEADFNNLDSKGNSTLILASALTRSSIVFEIIHRGADVNYVSPHGNYALLYSIQWTNPDLFNELWSRTDKMLIVNESIPFLYQYLTRFCGCDFDTRDWINCLYKILESDIAFELVDRYVIYSIEFCRITPLIHLMESFQDKNVSKEDRLKLLYLMLSYSVPVYKEDIFQMYEYFGFGEEMEALLFMEIDNTVIDTENKKRECLFVNLLLNVDSNEKSVMLKYLVDYFPSWRLFDFFKDILHVFQFCTPTSAFKNMYHTVTADIGYCFKEIDCDWEGDKGEIKGLNNAIVNKFDLVPSLVELSRDASRCFIINKFNICDISKFHSSLVNLELPKRVKDILLFKTALYN